MNVTNKTYSLFAVFLALALSALPPLVHAQQTSAALSQADQDFITKASQGNKAEVELGQLATDKASSPEVKKFAEHIVKDHSKANQKLSGMAKKKGVSISENLSEEAMQLKNTLAALNGAEFDKQYMAAMVNDHQKDIDEFQNESQQGQDKDVKNFAKQSLPTLKRHLSMAQSLASKTAS